MNAMSDPSVFRPWFDGPCTDLSFACQVKGIRLTGKA